MKNSKKYSTVILISCLLIGIFITAKNLTHRYFEDDKPDRKLLQEDFKSVTNQKFERARNLKKLGVQTQDETAIIQSFNEFLDLSLIYKDYKKPKSEAACLNQIGLLCYETGLNTLAEEYFHSCLDIYYNIDSINYLRLVMGNLIANRMHNNYDRPIDAYITPLVNKYNLNDDLYFKYLIRLDNGNFDDIDLNKLTSTDKEKIITVLIDAYQISGNYQKSNQYVDLYYNTIDNNDKIIRAQYFYGYNKKMLGEKYIHHFRNVFQSKKLINDNKGYHFDAGVELLEFSYDSKLALELASIKFNLKMSANIGKFDSILKANNNAQAIALFTENRRGFDNLLASLKDIVIEHERTKRKKVKRVLKKTVNLTFYLLILLSLVASIIISVLYKKVNSNDPDEMQAHIKKLEEAIKQNHDTIAGLSSDLQKSFGDISELNSIINDHKKFIKISREFKEKEIIQYHELLNNLFKILKNIESITNEPIIKKKVSEAVFKISNTLHQGNHLFNLN